MENLSLRLIITSIVASLLAVILITVLLIETRLENRKANDTKASGYSAQNARSYEEHDQPAISEPIFSIDFNNVTTQGSCNYFLPFETQGINGDLVKLGMNFSVHGFWLDGRIRFLNKCLSYEEFSYRFRLSLATKYMISDQQGDKDYCCHLQYHEYVKHGCGFGLLYEEWLKCIMMCVSAFQPNYFPYQCIHCWSKNCQGLLQISTLKHEAVNCKREISYCSTSHC